MQEPRVAGRIENGDAEPAALVRLDLRKPFHGALQPVVGVRGAGRRPGRRRRGEGEEKHAPTLPNHPGLLH